MKSWKLDPNGMLGALNAKGAEAAISFVQSHKRDIVRVGGWTWCVVLFVVFSFILTVRLAFSIPV